MTFWKDKRVFITGATGLIGASVCKQLLDLGAEPIGYDLEGYGRLRHFDIDWQVPVMLGDIRDSKTLNLAMSRADIVMHLAANSHVEKSRQDPTGTFDVGIRGTWTVLQAALENQVNTVVTASSNHVYGNQLGTGYETKPTKEEAQLNQLDTYSVGKICADYLARAYAHNYDLNTVIIRNTNCYGPADPHTDHIVSGSILALLREEAPVIRSRGVTKKSYLHVDDVARAYITAAQWGYECQGRGRVFNVSNNDPITAYELALTISLLMERPDLKPQVLGRTDDQQDERLDWTAFHNLTGWESEIDLKTGLTETIEYYKAKAYAHS